MPTELKLAATARPVEPDELDHNAIQAEDDDLSAFPTMRVFHELRILLADWSLLGELTRILHEHGAKVERLSLQTQNSGCIVTCRIEGLRPRGELAAVTKIRRIDGALNASVEHLLLRR